MLSKYKQKREQGFTIIEVLIVLAIAGLIMLVVFLAIPALQRNSRNNQRTTDVANILGAVGEYVSNNNGQLPDTDAIGAKGTDNTVVVIGGDGDNQVEVNLGYYEASKILLKSTVEDVDQETVRIVTAATCDGTGASKTGAPSRGYVASYMLETNSQQCRES